MTDVLLIAVQWVAVVVAVISRRWSLAIAGFCLPLTRSLPSTSIAGLNLTNLLLLVILFHTLLTGKRPPSGGRRDPVLIPATILLLFLFLSVLRVQFSDDVPVLFTQFGGRYANIQILKDMAFCFILYFCSRSLVIDPQILRATIVGVMSGYLFQAVLGAMAFFGGVDFDQRARGLVGEPNEFGLFLATYAMLPVAVVISRTPRFFLTAVPVVIVSLVGVLGSLSRGALVSAAGAVTVMASVKRTLSIVVVALVIGTSFFWLPQKTLDRFSETVSRDHTGLSSVPGFVSAEEFELNREARIRIWSAGMRMALANPLFGTGLGLFQYRIQEYGYHRQLNPHNQYLWLAAQCGIPAFLAYLGLLLGLARISLFLAWRRDDTLGSTYGLGMLGMIVSLLVGGMFLHNIFTTGFCGPFLILASIGVNHFARSTESPTS